MKLYKSQLCISGPFGSWLPLLRVCFVLASQIEQSWQNWQQGREVLSYPRAGDRNVFCLVGRVPRPLCFLVLSCVLLLRKNPKRGRQGRRRWQAFIARHRDVLDASPCSEYVSTYPSVTKKATRRKEEAVNDTQPPPRGPFLTGVCLAREN